MFGSFANQAEHDEIRLAIWKLKRKLKETANADTVPWHRKFLFGTHGNLSTSQQITLKC